MKFLNGIVLVAASVLLASPGVIVAQDHSVEELVIEMASTPQEHQAVAQHYTSKAAEARADARRHEGMARTYASGGRNRPQRAHCLALAEKYNEIAAEYDQLAKLHEEEAKTAR